MGIIAKQTVKGSIYTYAGVFLGFIGTGILMPKFFSTEQVGLTSILISVTLLFSQFATLGFASVNTRVFPYFRNNENGHNGLLLLGIIVTFAGFLISLVGLFLFKEPILKGNSGESDFISGYSNWLIPLVFFSVFFIFFDSFAKSLFDSVIGTMLKDFLVKLLNLILIIFYAVDCIDFDVFVAGYAIAYMLPTLILIFVLLKRKQLKLSWINSEMLKLYRKELIKVAFYGILTSFGSVALVNIDTITTNYYLGLSSAGIYSIVFFLSSLILMPSKSLRKISSIIVAEAWKNNDRENIISIYYKSTVNQFIIGFFIFGGILINIDSIFYFLPEYLSGKTALIILSIGFLIEMFSGVSAVIMQNSKYYGAFSLQYFLSILILTGFCIVLIPSIGINGTAIAIASNYLIFALIRYIYLYQKFKIQPYKLNHIKIICIAAINITIIFLIPDFKNLYLDVFIKSSLFTIIFFLSVYFSNVSDDINGLIKRITEKIRQIL